MMMMNSKAHNKYTIIANGAEYRHISTPLCLLTLLRHRKRWRNFSKSNVLVNRSDLHDTEVNGFVDTSQKVQPSKT